MKVLLPVGDRIRFKCLLDCQIAQTSTTGQDILKGQSKVAGTLVSYRNELTCNIQLPGASWTVVQSYILSELSFVISFT